MDNSIDLDEAARQIQQRIDDWRRAGLEVGAITWRDQGRGYPPPLVTNRTEAIDPDSIGVRITRGNAEGSAVLFKGGWVDFEWWDGLSQDSVVLDAPGYEQPLTIAEFGKVLDRLGDLFARSGRSG